MSVISKIRFFLNTEVFITYLIALVLALLFLGQAPSSIAIGLLIFFSVRYSILNKSYQKPNVALVLPILLYILFVLTWFWSLDKDLTKLGLERTVCLLLVPIAFILMPKISLKRFKLIFDIYTTSNIVLGIFFLVTALFKYFQTQSIAVFKYHNLVSVLDLHAIYVSLSFLMSLFYLISKTHKTRKDIIAILFFITFLLLLSSKTMVFVLITGILTFFLFNNFKKGTVRMRLLISIFTILGMLLGYVTLKDRFLYERDTKLHEVLTKEEFGKVYPWTGSSIRALQLRILKEQVEEEYIFWKGFGIFASRDNIKKRHLSFNTYPEFHNYNYHNQYAQILSETGIFGLILLLGMLITSYYKAIQNRDLLFLIFCIAMSITFFTESLLWRQHGLFLFIMLYCLFNITSFKNEGLNITIS